MNAITGIGSIINDRYETSLKSEAATFSSLKELYRDFRVSGELNGAVKNFERFDVASKMICLATALALKDAGKTYPIDQDCVVGQLLISHNATLTSNLEYFRDYVQNGKIMGRASLFIYTLPTSSLGENSICYGFTGPAQYIGVDRDLLKSALDHAQLMLEAKYIDSVVVAVQNESSVSVFIVSKKFNKNNNVILLNDSVFYENAVISQLSALYN